MLRAEKGPVVDGLRDTFARSSVLIVTHYKGLNVAEATDLRRQLLEAGAGFRVTKNTLAKLAVANTPFEPLTEMFVGPTAVAYSPDPVAAPKVIAQFAKKNAKLVVIGGVLSGALLTPEQVKDLSELPSLDELRGKLVGLLNAPAQRLVTVLGAPGAQLARVVQARVDQQQDAS